MATVPIRKVALLVGAVAVVATVITLGVVISGDLAVAQGILLVVSYGLAAAVAVLGAVVLQVKRSVSAVAAKHTRELAQLNRTMLGAVKANTEAVRAQGKALESAVQAAVQTSTAQTTGQLESSFAVTGKRLDQIGADVTAGRADTLQTYWQIEALLDLRAMLQPRALMPQLRNWAASPDVLRWLAEYVASHRPELIVECGSGASSLVMGYAVQKAGFGRVISLEHDADYAEASARRVVDHGLQDVVEVRHAPLTPWAGPDEQTWNWYDLTAVKDLHGIGLVFVDGPPAGTSRLARYPAMPVLLSHCADEVAFVLDDTIRAEEVEISNRWMQESPGFTRQVLRADKGIHVLSRRSTS
ncbi:class I SAM-dependent methyltransferase [Kribbella sp. NPDC055071]